jgi:hypothetical protein
LSEEKIQSVQVIVSRSLAQFVDGLIAFKSAGTGTASDLPGTSAFQIAGELRPERTTSWVALRSNCQPLQMSAMHEAARRWVLGKRQFMAEKSQRSRPSKRLSLCCSAVDGFRHEPDGVSAGVVAGDLANSLGNCVLQL